MKKRNKDTTSHTEREPVVLALVRSDGDARRTLRGNVPPRRDHGMYFRAPAINMSVTSKSVSYFSYA